MRFELVEISGVRNLRSVTIDCGPRINLFVGANGAGKTAILEAIHLLARGRSFRSSSIASVIAHDLGALMVRAVLVDEARGRLRAGITRYRSNKTELRINERPERLLSEVARLVPLQLLLPDSSDLVFGSPGGRRHFIDWGLFHVEQRYLSDLRSYQQALQQRNAVLKVSGSETSSELEVWTRQLLEWGCLVDQARQGYVKQLAPYFSEQMDSLSGGLPVDLCYASGWNDGASLEESLVAARGRDVKFGTTHCGPHRGDLRILVGRAAAAMTLSRGQAKVVASALRLAQASLTQAAVGRGSVFLIDDLGAELDTEHCRRFFTALDRLNCQVFSTATSHSAAGLGVGECKVFHVKQGTLETR